jgi:Flp pilus assembly protein TadG
MTRHLVSFASPRSQRGVALVLIVAAMAALLLMAGLALDVGHATLNKSRLQNATDAAALSAAKALDQTGDIQTATAVAVQAFKNNANGIGNQELASAYANGSGQISVTVQYSAALPPFTPGSAAGPYVRVIATGFNWPSWLVQLAGASRMAVTASAVAGPSPRMNNACNIAPMMVCGDPAAGAANLWGYTLNAPTVLKSAAPGSSVGPGNFQLVQLGSQPGAAAVSQNLAGGYAGCATNGDSITTQTGNETGPVADGLNTRFNEYKGPLGGSQSQYPPDVIDKPAPSTPLSVDANGNIVVTAQGSGKNSGGTTTIVTASNIDTIAYSYKDYNADVANGNYDVQPVQNGGTAAFQRRILTMPVADCSGTNNGKSTIPVLGFACYFLLQPVAGTGNTDQVFGQFIGRCDVNGTPGPAPGGGPGPYVIQLYHDPDSGDS